MFLACAIVCFFLGAGLGLRFKVLVLVPAIVIMLPIICVAMAIGGHSFWSAAVSSFGCSLVLQFGYLGGALISFLASRVRREKPRDEACIFPDQMMAEPTRFFAGGKGIGEPD
ncbi:hypothetical protein MCBRY_003820 [Methylocystis bryophila]|uniref:Uncharacterized protein n=1 Tax=Methylocystis bryophila TaxID=655015 RepID=A0A1W6MVJ1_9HYPH|nr:hypothetical protein B1812_10930 [Methylocystis bryophila]